MKRTSCGACGGQDLDQFLDLGMSPVADAYTATADEISPTYPLQVAVCAKCKLVQLLEVLDGQTLFGTGYSFYSSASPPLSAYHATYAADALKRFGNLPGRNMLEVGCNDGDLLRHFDAAGWSTLGVDPAEGPAEVARGRGLEVLVEPFGLQAAHRIREDRGRVDVVVANHVLAHVADVADVLSGIAHVLSAGGVALVEVQYLPDLLVNNAFDLVYHEHRNFFSLSSLEQAALRWGLKVVDAMLTDRQGGSLRVVLAKTVRYSQTAEALRSSERWLHSFSAYEGMQGRAERIRARLRDLLAAQLLAGNQVSGYGAPAKATTLLNFCHIDASWLVHVTDTTPAKQGRFIPGTGIPILAPDLMGRLDTPARVILSWNYTSTIVRSNPYLRGDWIVPFPAPVVL